MEQKKRRVFLMSIEELLEENERMDLLRLVTAGSVDDGKSTLIGRLLYESKGIYEDQLDAIESIQSRVQPESVLIWPF